MQHDRDTQLRRGPATLQHQQPDFSLVFLELQQILTGVFIPTFTLLLALQAAK